jgi:hypothetical protein
MTFPRVSCLAFLLLACSSTSTQTPTDAAVSDKPVTDVPVTDVPVADTPVADVPSIDAPAVDSPAADAPIDRADARDADDAPALDAPSDRPDAPPADAPSDRADVTDVTDAGDVTDAAMCTTGGGCHAFWCGCGRCDPSTITCTPDERGCPLACASACPELTTAVCRCEGGRCGAPVFPDAGVDSGLPLGANCASNDECASGLLCCYPCGIPGCHNRCITPMAGRCPLFP